ncbi:hypothetical protein HDZ31DRAFT_34825, partial [Schizophyllum fasciatum]
PRGKPFFLSATMSTSTDDKRCEDSPSSEGESPDRQSERFNATGAGVIVFRSSDRVLFNIHRANLRAVSDGPLAEDFPASAGEVADLAEDEDTLELLFRYIYPGRLPSIALLDLERLCALAEAAEKYGVGPAVHICHYRLEQLHQEHPLQVLAYAHRHGYRELMDRCARLGLGTRYSEVRGVLPAHLMIAWAAYSDVWQGVIMGQASATHSQRFIFQTTGTCAHGHCKIKDKIESAIYKTIVEQGPHKFLLDLHRHLAVLHEVATSCTIRKWEGLNCHIMLDRWETELQKKTQEIAPFSDFVGLLSA